MSLELTARTEPGARLVALADELAAEIAPHAARHDREASFPFESFDDDQGERLLRWRRSPKSSAGSASSRCTTSSSRRAASPAATPR